MKTRRSIRAQLLILVLITTIPVLLLLIVATYTDVQDESNQAHAAALNLAQLTTGHIEQWLRDSETLLARAAQRPDVRALDPERCDESLADMSELFQPYLGFGLIDREGRVICATNAEPEGPLPSVVDREWFQAILRDRKFVVSDVQVGRVTGRWVTILAYPVFTSDGEFGGAAILPVDLTWFQSSLNQVSLPPNGTITIVDSQGAVVARSVDPERWVGVNVRGVEVADLVMANQSGQARATGVDGIDRLYGYTTIPSASWHVYVGIPAREALQPVQRAVARNIVLSLAVIAVVGVVSWYFRRQIVEPLYQMAQVAGAVAAGDRERRAPVGGPRELAYVAVQFNRMLDVRAEHTARLERQARELATLAEMGQAVASTLDLDVVLDRVLNEVTSLVPAEGVSIILREDNTLRLAASKSNAPDLGLSDDNSLHGAAVDQALRDGRALMLNNAARLREFGETDANTAAGSLLIVPLVLRDEIIGVIKAVNSEESAFNTHDLRLLKATGTWTAIAIGNARTFQEELRAHRLADALRTANASLSETLDQEVILERLLDHAREMAPYQTGTILLNDAAEQWRIAHARGEAGIGSKNAAPPAAIDLAAMPHLQQVVQSHEGVLINEPLAQTEWAAATEAEVTQSWLGVALPQRKQKMGILSLHRHSGAPFSQTDLRLIEALTAQAATALQNASLFEEVRSSREQLQNLTQQLVTAQENERKRLSQELHDDAGQMLTALQLNLGMIRSRIPQELSDIQDSIAEANEIASETMERLRWLSQDLRPPALQHTTILQAVEGLCRDFAHRTEIDIHCQGQEVGRLPDDVSLSLYRFVQEGLTNVAKHAAATEVHVALYYQDQRIEATVADNGCGFNVEDKLNGFSHSGHYGLSGMKERLQLVGGELHIDSEPGRGTVLAASIPLADREAE
ncbi:MAG TPA: cache domain-containing protein [Candidatus Sulfomarinibacteraceae bacterium]|nr:cache domain-containing protein [Candidatus Sulfomarinibacteraceae bacterium]